MQLLVVGAVDQVVGHETRPRAMLEASKVMVVARAGTYSINRRKFARNSTLVASQPMMPRLRLSTPSLRRYGDSPPAGRDPAESHGMSQRPAEPTRLRLPRTGNCQLRVVRPMTSSATASRRQLKLQAAHQRRMGGRARTALSQRPTLSPPAHRYRRKGNTGNAPCIGKRETSKVECGHRQYYAV